MYLALSILGMSVANFTRTGVEGLKRVCRDFYLFLYLCTVNADKAAQWQRLFQRK